MPPAYKVGQVVWLKRHVGFGYVDPRQRCELIAVNPDGSGLMYQGKVEPDPDDPDDDGLREFEEEHIEGLA